MKKSKELWQRMGEWVEENGLIEDGGASLVSFCAFFSIDKVTFYNWMKNSTFSTIITRARETFRQNLEREIVMSLAKVAKGYTYKEKHEKVIIKSNSKGQPVIDGKQEWTKDVSVAPNVQAATWLLPRISDRWNVPDKHDVNLNAPQGVTITCETKQQEDILKRLQDKCKN